jgi:hypothetical protein
VTFGSSNIPLLATANNKRCSIESPSSFSNISLKFFEYLVSRIVHGVDVTSLMTFAEDVALGDVSQEGAVVLVMRD